MNFSHLKRKGSAQLSENCWQFTLKHIYVPSQYVKEASRNRVCVWVCMCFHIVVANTTILRTKIFSFFFFFLVIESIPLYYYFTVSTAVLVLCNDNFCDSSHRWIGEDFSSVTCEVSVLYNDDRDDNGKGGEDAGIAFSDYA